MPKSTPNKTQPTSLIAEEFLNNIEDMQLKKDCMELLKIISEITQEEPVMWGSSIVGFGKYHYKYESGREGDAAIVGFSPRKLNLTIYITPGFDDYDQTGITTELMPKLGKYKTGKSCLYIKSLSDINIEILKKLIQRSVEYMKQKYKQN